MHSCRYAYVYVYVGVEAIIEYHLILLPTLIFLNNVSINCLGIHLLSQFLPPTYSPNFMFSFSPSLLPLFPLPSFSLLNPQSSGCVGQLVSDVGPVLEVVDISGVLPLKKTDSLSQRPAHFISCSCWKDFIYSSKLNFVWLYLAQVLHMSKSLSSYVHLSWFV